MEVENKNKYHPNTRPSVERQYRLTKYRWFIHLSSSIKAAENTRATTPEAIPQRTNHLLNPSSGIVSKYVHIFLQHISFYLHKFS